MKQSRLAVFAAFALTAASAFAAPETFMVDKTHSGAAFKVRHLMSSVSGKFNDFDATVNIDRAKPVASNVEFTIKTASIDTGVGDRDKHLRSADFFDAEKYPTITFKSSKIESTRDKSVFNVTGDLTMRGVTKKVTLPVTFNGFARDPWGNERAGFDIETTLNRKDYGINWNKALDQGGYLLDDNVKVSLSLEAVKKK